MSKLDLNSLNINDKDIITHTGIVTAITDKSVRVSLQENPNCTSCHAKAACGIVDTETKLIEIRNNQQSVKLHDRVNVFIENKSLIKAIFIAYVFPFILLFASLIVFLIFFKEWLAGLSSLLVVTLYYFSLHFINNFLKKEFQISILKQN